MSRDVVLLGAAVVVLGLISAGAPGANAAEVRGHRAHSARVSVVHADVPRHAAVRRRVARSLITASVATARPALPVRTYQVPAPTIDTSYGTPVSLAYQPLSSSGRSTPSTSTSLSAQELEA